MKNLYLITIVLLYSVAATGQAWPLSAKLEATDKQANDNNAYSVDISGDWAVTGAYFHDLDGAGSNSLNNAGAAYVIVRNGSGTWVQEKKLVTDDTDRFGDDKLGWSVGMDGDRVIAGAPENNLDSTAPKASIGTAYVFDKDSMTTGIYTYSRSNKAVLYPNPTTGIAYVLLEDGVRDVRVMVYNSIGQVVVASRHTNSNKIKVDISEQPTGIYAIEILADGEHLRGGLLLKE